MTTYYLFETRQTKPADAIWWPNQYVVESDIRWNTLNSIVTYCKYTLEDVNTKKFALYFNTEEQYLTYRTAMAALSSTPGRTAYNAEHNIVTTILHDGFVEVDPATL